MTVYTPTSERQAPATTHRQMWALGDYAAIAEELLAPLGSNPSLHQRYSPRRSRA